VDSVDTLQSIQAARSGHAVPRLMYRHDHLAAQPFVISGFHLAGDQGAVMALMWGSDPATPSMVIVPEPRDRDLRFQRMAEFADALVGYLSSIPDGQAPQVVFPNASTAGWLLKLVGRFTRYRPETNTAPESVAEMGRLLSLLYEQKRIPGSSTVLTMTEVLSRQFANGQLNAENENLLTQLAWITPPTGSDGRTAALAAENELPVGPLTDPQWDADVLEPAMAIYRQARDVSERALLDAERQLTTRHREALQPGWLATWTALDVMRGLPEARHVSSRWAEDVWRWENYAPAVFDGSRRFSIHPTPIGSAILLHTLEDAVQDLAHEMAVDDPLVLARHELAGRAVTGSVVAVDLADRDVVKGKLLIRPTLQIDTIDPALVPIGTDLFLTTDPAVKVKVIAKAGLTVTIRVVAGALRSNTFGKLPTVGGRAAFCVIGPARFRKSDGQFTIPWTHTMGEPAAAEEGVAS
jgi:hypothetical protein